MKLFEFVNPFVFCIYVISDFLEKSTVNWSTMTCQLRNWANEEPGAWSFFFFWEEARGAGSPCCFFETRFALLLRRSDRATRFAGPICVGSSPTTSSGFGNLLKGSWTGLFSFTGFPFYFCFLFLFQCVIFLFLLLLFFIFPFYCLFPSFFFLFPFSSLFFLSSFFIHVYEEMAKISKMLKNLIIVLEFKFCSSIQINVHF